MAVSGRSRWHAKTGTVTVTYASGENLILEPTEGNLSIGGMNAGNHENTKVMNRMHHDGFVEGPDLVQDVSIDLQMPREVLTSAVAKKIIDFFLQTGFFAGAMSCDSTIVAHIWELDVTDGSISGKIYLPLVEGELSFSEGAEFNTLSFSGRNHLAPVFS